MGKMELVCGGNAIGKLLAVVNPVFIRNTKPVQNRMALVFNSFLLIASLLFPDRFIQWRAALFSCDLHQIQLCQVNHLGLDRIGCGQLPHRMK